MNHLIKLLALNKGKGNFHCEKSGNDATIYLYDAIVSDDFWGGVSATAFVKELSALKADTIHLRINCPGGDVFAGRAIEQAIREHPSKVVAHIDGYAASAASYVALAADEVVMAQGAMYMIHNAWTLALGNADDLRSTADLLDKIDGLLVQTYVDSTGNTADKVREWMSAETWFTAEEAVANGFAGSIAESKKATKNLAQWDMSAYAHAPQIKQDDEELPVVSVANTDHLLRKLDLITRT